MSEALIQAVQSLIKDGGTLALWAVAIIQLTKLAGTVILAVYIPPGLLKIVRTITDGLRNSCADSEYRKILTATKWSVENGDRETMRMEQAELIRAVACPPGWTRGEQ